MQFQLMQFVQPTTFNSPLAALIARKGRRVNSVPPGSPRMRSVIVYENVSYGISWKKRARGFLTLAALCLTHIQVSVDTFGIVYTQYTTTSTVVQYVHLHYWLATTVKHSFLSCSPALFSFYSGGQHRALYARNCPPSCHTSRPI